MPVILSRPQCVKSKPRPWMSTYLAYSSTCMELRRLASSLDFSIFEKGSLEGLGGGSLRALVLFDFLRRRGRDPGIVTKYSVCPFNIVYYMWAWSQSRSIYANSNTAHTDGQSLTPFRCNVGAEKMIEFDIPFATSTKIWEYEVIGERYNDCLLILG